MSDKEKENRINVEDLPVAEKELSAEEAKNVKGGAWHELVILGDVAAARKTPQDKNSLKDPS